LNELGYQWSVLSPLLTDKFRLAEVKYLVETFVESGTVGLPTVICGDFNENDSGGSLSYLTNNGTGGGIGVGLFGKPTGDTVAAKLTKLKFVDAVHKYVPSGVETHRFPFPFDRNKILRSRLDHVLYTKDKLDCLCCRVIPGFEDQASDHMPILSIFSFLEGAVKKKPEKQDKEKPTAKEEKEEVKTKQSDDSNSDSASEGEHKAEKSPPVTPRKRTSKPIKDHEEEEEDTD